MLTQDILKGVHGTSKVKITNANSQGTDSDGQDAPPPNSVASCPLAKSSKKKKKRELDGPQAAIEQHIKRKNWSQETFGFDYPRIRWY